MEDLKTKHPKKGTRAIGVNISKKDHDDSPEADWDDNIDMDLLREKRRDELIAYELILFGEKPD